MAEIVLKSVKNCQEWKIGIFNISKQESAIKILIKEAFALKWPFDYKKVQMCKCQGSIQSNLIIF